MYRYTNFKVHAASNFDICSYVYISATPIDNPGGLRFGLVASLLSILFNSPVNNTGCCQNYQANVHIWPKWQQMRECVFLKYSVRWIVYLLQNLKLLPTAPGSVPVAKIGLKHSPQCGSLIYSIHLLNRKVPLQTGAASTTAPRPPTVLPLTCTLPLHRPASSKSSCLGYLYHMLSCLIPYWVV